MIKVTTGNNIKRSTAIVPETTTLRSVLENAEIDATRGATTLDGAFLQPADLDKTFADFGVTDKCYLLNVAKVDNA